MMPSPQQSKILKKMGARKRWLRQTVTAILWTAFGLLLTTAPAAAGDYTYTFDDITVNESDGTADLTIQLNQTVLSGEEITIQIKDDDSQTSASKGSDYKNPPNNVTIDAGQNNVRFSVPIVDDALVEPDEYFYITIDPQLTQGSGANFGSVWGTDKRVYFTSLQNGSENVWAVRPLAVDAMDRLSAWADEPGADWAKARPVAQKPYQRMLVTCSATIVLRRATSNILIQNSESWVDCPFCS